MSVSAIDSVLSEHCILCFIVWHLTVAVHIVGDVITVQSSLKLLAKYKFQDIPHNTNDATKLIQTSMQIHSVLESQDNE